MRSAGTPQIILDLISDLQRCTQSRVRIKSLLSEPFITISVVRQSCVLAPALFCRAIDWILQRALQNCGIELFGSGFTDTDYANDIVHGVGSRYAETSQRTRKHASSENQQSLVYVYPGPRLKFRIGSGPCTCCNDFRSRPPS